MEANNLLDEICMPFLYMAVYKGENEVMWCDPDQITSKTVHVFLAEKCHSALVAEIKFHPTVHYAPTLIVLPI